MNSWEIFTAKIKYLVHADIKKDAKLEEWKKLVKKFNKQNFVPSHFGNLI